MSRLRHTGQRKSGLIGVQQFKNIRFLDKLDNFWTKIFMFCPAKNAVFMRVCRLFGQKDNFFSITLKENITLYNKGKIFLANCPVGKNYCGKEVRLANV